MESDRAAKRLYSADSHTTTSIASDGYGVYVNPWGLMGSWKAGSMESILEVAWASNVFQQGGSNNGYVEQQVSDFYQTFYGYELSDDEYQGITEGPAK